MSYQQYRPNRFQLIPEIVKHLLIINGLFFLATIALGQSFNIDLSEYLGLFYVESEHFYPFQYVSHMFMHGSFSHILFNMFALWMFGGVLENHWGPKKFIVFYMIAGLGAGLLHTLANFIELQSLINNVDLTAAEEIKRTGRDLIRNGQNFRDATYAKLNLTYNIPVVGASGAVYGLLVAFAMMFPNTNLYLLFFPFPIKAKYMVIGLLVIDLFFGIQPRFGTGIAHFAHIGGALFGFLTIMYWRYK